ncbi:MAG: hypothetical protein HKN18_16575 [Silicimonas sp.]|nr:hypothetical protein [Silicimonas sp.]
MSRFFCAATALAVVLLANPTSAQIVPYKDIAGYKVARVESQNVCFAAAEFGSDEGHQMLYSYYQTSSGQRWHVAGYASEARLAGDEVAVRVTIDGTVTLERATETRQGDFMLPFEALPEIQAHEALVQTGETMEISVNDGDDTLRVPLSDYRAALGAIAACLNSL